MKNKVKILLALTLACVMVAWAGISVNAAVIYNGCVCGSEAWEYWDSPKEYGSSNENSHLVLYYTSSYCSMCKGMLLEFDYSREESHDFSFDDYKWIGDTRYRVYVCPCGATMLTPDA